MYKVLDFDYFQLRKNDVLRMSRFTNSNYCSNYNVPAKVPLDYFRNIKEKGINNLGSD